jgi:hypothetical protein
MLERESVFYKAHQVEFREKYPDKWLVITGDSLFGVYETLKEAAKNALDHLKPGEFIIHRPADDGKVIEIGPIINVRDPAEAKNQGPGCIIKTTGGDLVTYSYA